MKIVIRTIDNSSPEFAKVIKLAQTNSGTLGFLPKEAFKNYAARGQLLGAFENSQLVGYLLYAVNLKGRFVYIVHLCVEERRRQQGIAQALFSELKDRTKNDFRGIRVRCRRDYEATVVWPKLGFAAVDETKGRSKQGSTLTIWWFNHGHPDLFSQIYDQPKEPKAQVVMDANIFFELEHPDCEKNKGSKALLNDWLQENIELCLTQEILNEINRHADPSIRRKARAFASTFDQVTCQPQKFERVLANLNQILPKPVSERDKSDFRQLAWAIGAETSFFVTHDKKLLKRGDKIYDKFGIQIWPPSLLIINQDNLIREAEYQPARLTGSNLKVERLHAAKAAQVEEIFFAQQKETKAEFRNRLHLCLAEPRVFETRLISGEEGLLGLIVMERRKPKKLNVPILRVSADKLSATLARHLIHDSILTASKEGRVLTIIEDPYLSPKVTDAFPELGFMPFEDIWIKVNLTLIETAENISNALNSLSVDFPKFGDHFKNLANSVRNSFENQNRNKLLQIEKALWPAKISNLDLDAFVIPIRPHWALHLFDTALANQDLFGSEPTLKFNVENAYYRSNRPKVLTAPARILWYVSKGGTKLQGTMALRASSYLEEVVIDKPKVVFSRFRRLGVYKWQNVYEIAKQDTDNDIMAFRFSNTELFDNPILFTKLRKIWKKKTNSSFVPRSPSRIDNNMFLDLYKMGNKERVKEPAI